MKHSCTLVALADWKVAFTESRFHGKSETAYWLWLAQLVFHNTFRLSKNNADQLPIEHSHARVQMPATYLLMARERDWWQILSGPVPNWLVSITYYSAAWLCAVENLILVVWFCLLMCRPFKSISTEELPINTARWLWQSWVKSNSLVHATAHVRTGNRRYVCFTWCTPLTHSEWVTNRPAAVVAEVVVVRCLFHSRISSSWFFTCMIFAVRSKAVCSSSQRSLYSSGTFCF